MNPDLTYNLGAKDTSQPAFDSLWRSVEKTDKAFEQLGKPMNSVERGLKGVSDGSRRAAHQSRMMAMQFSQVAQQASVTGNVVQALAIQLPDMALGFGTIGIAIGAAAGALLLVGSELISTEGKMKSFDDSLKDVRATSDRLQESLDLLASSTVDLSDKYGLAASRVYEFALAQAEIRAGDAERALDAQSGSLQGLVQGYITSSDEGLRYEATIARIGDAFSVTSNQADVLKDAFRDLYISDGFGEQQAALEEIVHLFKDYEVDLKALPDDFSDAVNKMIELSNATDEARSISEKLASAIGSAADEAGRLAANSFGGSGARGDPRQFEKDEYWRNKYFPDPEDPVKARKKRSSSKRTKRPEDNFTDEMRDAELIFESTRSAAERYAAELDDLQELHKMGYLDADTYSRALKALGDQYAETSEAAGFFKDQAFQAFRDLAPVIDTGNAALDKFLNTLIDATMQAALLGEGPLAKMFGSAGGGLLGSLFGGLGGGFKSNTSFGAFLGLPSADGGGYTGAGSRSGGMDGKGGFPAILHPDETIIDHTKVGLRSSGGNTTVTVINNSGGQVREDRKKGPSGDEFVEVIIDKVKSEMGEGGFDSPLGGRFGAKPVRVRRGGS